MNIIQMRARVKYGVGACPHGKSGGSSAPAPDPSIGQAQLQEANLEQEEYNDYVNTYQPQELQLQQQANAIDQQQVTAQSALEQSQTQMTNNEDSLYTNTYEPLMQNMVSQATNYNTQANYNQQAQLAAGDVNNTAAAQQQAQAMQMKSVGVDPTSGAFQSMWNADGINTAAQGAAAASRAQVAAQQLGWNMEDQAAAMGQALPSDANQSAAVATNSGNSASSNANSTLSNNTQSTSLNNSSIGSAANIEQGIGQLGVGTYQTQVNAWNEQQQMQAQSSAGIGSAIGGLVGLGAAAYMSPPTNGAADFNGAFTMPLS